MRTPSEVSRLRLRAGCNRPTCSWRRGTTCVRSPKRNATTSPLHYFTQRFRTRSLGDFLAAQRKILEEFRGRSFPTMVNFSDGPTFHANFFSQGVDYFELLDADDQNAIWGEDWANNSSTYQCAGFNVALMQAAARQREQTVGHYLIAHAGRTPWDTKTKAVSETARGVRMWQNFSYGPSWSSHEGGPPSHSHLWWGQPDLWRANAEITARKSEPSKSGFSPRSLRPPMSRSFTRRRPTSGRCGPTSHPVSTACTHGWRWLTLKCHLTSCPNAMSPQGG